MLSGVKHAYDYKEAGQGASVPEACCRLINAAKKFLEMGWLEILPKEEGKEVQETYIVYESLERAFRRIRAGEYPPDFPSAMKDRKKRHALKLASNKVPGGDEQLTVRTKDNRRAGYHFTFSVPKSVSIYLALSKDKEVETMMQEAFRQTMADIEGRVETRVRTAGQDSERLTGNMVYASFFHTVTRPMDGIPDPHYHIHAYVFNGTSDAVEERWKAGQFGGLKREAPFFEAAFNSRLAENLVQAGYGIRRTDRDFELSSVSRQLIEKFSKRTQLIEQLARERYTMLEAEVSRYDANPEKFREKARARARSPEQIERDRAAAKAYREEHKAKIAAQQKA